MVKSTLFEAAKQNAQAFEAKHPRAIDAHYDSLSGMIDVALSTGFHLRFIPGKAQGLEHARPAQLNKIEITASGYGLFFPDLDADLFVPGLMDGIFGSKKWMAARLGRLGGKSRSSAKRAASRANGKLGGRPKKKSA